MSSPAPSPAPAGPSLVEQFMELEQVMKDTQVARYFWVAALCLLFYDHFLVFKQETKYVWSTKWSWIKALYILNRIWPEMNLIFNNVVMASHYSPSFCKFYFQFFAYSALPTHFSVQTILVIRLYAMFGCSRKILIFLSGLLTAEFVTETVLIGIDSAGMIPLPVPPILPGCYPGNLKTWSWAYWVPALVAEATLFSLALWKSFQSRDSQRPYLLVVLVRDSIIYFGGILFILVPHFFIWLLAAQSKFTTILGMAFCFHSILGCRMLINIRRAASGSAYDTALVTGGENWKMNSLGSTAIAARATPSGRKMSDYGTDSGMTAI